MCLSSDQQVHTAKICLDIMYARLKKDALGAYHLARKSRNFGLKSNGKVIFWKFHSKLWSTFRSRYSSFSARNGTAEISLPFAKLSNF